MKGEDWLFAWFVYRSRPYTTVDKKSFLFLITSSCSRVDRPASTRENMLRVWTLLHFGSIAHWALLSNATFKGPDREILDNFTSHWNETGWWANLLSALRLSGAAAEEEKKRLSSFAKQHQVHKQATYLNEPDNYLNIFPLLLQWAPINERGCLKLSARVYPRGINFTEAHIWVWGWMVGVGGGNWFNVSEAMPASQNTNAQWW